MSELMQVVRNFAGALQVLGGALETPPLGYCSGTLILAHCGVCCQGTTASKMRKSGLLFHKFVIFFVFACGFVEMGGLEGSFLAK
jgi:hypothetical protein